MENQQPNTTTQEQPDVGSKTFTQDDVNRIVQDRLNRERAKPDAKPDATLAQREQDLAKREFQLYAKDAIRKAGLSDQWIDALDNTNQEKFDKALAFVAKELNTSLTKPSGGSGFSGMKPPYGGDDPVRQAMGLK